MDQLTLPGTIPCSLITVDVFLHADGVAHAALVARGADGRLLHNLSGPARPSPELAYDDAVRLLRDTFFEVVEPF